MITRCLAALSLAALNVPSPLPAQDHAASPPGGPDWLALVELPVLATAVVFGFLTAGALRGGRLGTGMILIAWGFLVMAVGHLHMQMQAVFGFDLFHALFGSAGGHGVWVAVLVVTWSLTATGFYRLYRASTRV